MDHALNALLDDTLPASTAAPQDILLTNHFGDFVVHADTILTFDYGIIGFSAFKTFALVKLPHVDTETPFRLLVSLEEPHLSFIVFPTTCQSPLIDKEDVSALCDRYKITPSDLLLLHIASIQEDAKFGNKITLNLKAPIVIDASTRRAEQHVFTDKDYALHYRMDGQRKTV
ncbi:MAG: flagellar assembly protein FliW [Alphaproteobacteria bacterium]